MSIPLKAKVAIRDHWSAASSPAAKALETLHSLLGVRIVCEPEWPLLLAELDTVYPDRAQFVTAVVEIVQAWCLAAGELFDGEQEWSDEALEKVKEAGSLGLFVEVSKDDSPATAWSPGRNGFTIALPKVAIRQALEFIPLFKSQLMTTFEEPPQSQINPPPADDWTDVVVTSTTKPANISSKPTAKVEYLPSAESLPRPDDLLLQPPYHLSVRVYGSSEIDVQSSHGPSLELLAAYLKKWCRTNTMSTDRPPLVTIELRKSAFGLGLIHDSLSIAAENRYGGITHVPPPIVLSLVEGVLGYERIYSDASCWHYRRESAFKRL